MTQVSEVLKRKCLEYWCVWLEEILNFIGPTIVLNFIGSFKNIWIKIVLV
jgi:hypothetical protein